MIVLLETVHPDAEAILREVDDVVIAPSPTSFPDVPPAAVAAVVTRGLGRITRTLIDSLPSLHAVARCGAGVDNIDTAAADERGITVVYAPGVTSNAVGEHAMMLALCLARQTVRLAAATAGGDWAIRDRYAAMELAGRRMGIVGLGGVGRRVAELGAAFGMDVVGWARRPRPGGAVAHVGLDELLMTSDVIQLCVALSADTVGLIDAARLEQVRHGSLLINTARGALVDPVAVEAALDSGRLAGYATDVVDPEPPPAGSPLLSHPRVLVTPHVAAFTDVTYRALCVGPAAAVAAILGGRSPDPECVFAAR